MRIKRKNCYRGVLGQFLYCKMLKRMTQNTSVQKHAPHAKLYQKTPKKKEPNRTNINNNPTDNKTIYEIRKKKLNRKN